MVLQPSGTAPACHNMGGGGGGGGVRSASGCAQYAYEHSFANLTCTCMLRTLTQLNFVPL